MEIRHLPIRAHFQNIPNSLYRIKKNKTFPDYWESQFIPDNITKNNNSTYWILTSACWIWSHHLYMKIGPDTPRTTIGQKSLLTGLYVCHRSELG